MCLVGVKTADPGDSFSTRTESAVTSSQTTVERRDHQPTPNSSKTNSKIKEAAPSVKVRLGKMSGIDEKIQEECRQVYIVCSKLGFLRGRGRDSILCKKNITWLYEPHLHPKYTILKVLGRVFQPSNCTEENVNLK